MPTPPRPSSCASSLTFMGLSIGLGSLFWLFSTRVPHLTPSTTRSYSNACSCLLAYLVTSSPGWLHSSMAAPSAWSMGPLGPNGSPPLMAFPRNRCRPLFSISSTHRNLVLTDCALLGQLYADDVQAYLHCLASDVMAAIQAMTLATGALVAWMSSNRLRLNPSKTQYIWLGTRQQLAKLDLAAMAVRFPHYSLLTYCSRLGTHTGSAAYLCSSH